MITVKTLKKLLKQVPDDAMVYAYEEYTGIPRWDIGISITLGDKVDGQYWWIRAHEDDEIDTYIEGFKEE